MNSRTRPHRLALGRAGGFTLVEVLVALVIMAVMAVMAWQGVDGIVRTRNTSQTRLEQTLRMSTVIAQWDQDLASIQDSGVIEPPISCDGASVRLTRRTPQGLQVVAWSLRQEQDGNNWVRWAGPAVTTVAALQDSWLRSQQLQGGEPGSLRTLTGLGGWQVYFFQGTNWANCQSSGDVSTSTTSTAATSATTASAAASGAGTSAATGSTSATPTVTLPKGVRIVLSFAPGGGQTGDLTRDTVLSP